MATMIYKEEIVRWVAIEIEDGDESMSLSELEDEYRDKTMEHIATNGWDDEDVLDALHLVHTAEDME